MTQIIYYKKDNVLIAGVEQEDADTIQRKMQRGRWRYPVPFRRPRCRRLADLLIVSECREAPDWPALSNDKQRVMELLAQGMTTMQIALALQLSDGTIRYHINTLKKFFGVTTRHELIARYWKDRDR